MRKIQDNSILNLKEIKSGQMVIPTQDGYEMREVGNRVRIGDDIILLYTLSKNGKQYLHYSYCNKNNVKDWAYGGKMPIYSDFFAKTKYHQLEDPFLEIRESDGRFILYAEDKDKQGHTIVQYNSGDWDYKTNTGFWDGGRTTMAPADYGSGRKAIYSYMSFTKKEQYYYYYEARDTDKYKDISIGYGGNRSIVLPFNADWNIVVPDVPYKIREQIVVFCHGFYKDGKWHVFLADATDPLHWKYLSEFIKLPEGAWAEVVPIYADKWRYLYNDGGKGMRLGVAGDTAESDIPDVPDEPDYSEHINNNPNLPKHSSSVSDDVLLMRQAKPLILGLTIPANEEVDRKLIIDLIDEIG